MSSTDLTNFRNQFLVAAQAKLQAVDITAADSNGLIIAGALLKQYDNVNKFDPVGPDAITPLTLMTGAQVEAYVTDPSGRQSFELILSGPEALKALVASSTAMTAVAASSTAMTALLANSTAWATVVASSTAMTAVAASSTAMTAVAASSTAMTALLANSTAWATVVASSTAMTAVAASSTAMTAVAASSTAMTAVAASSTAMTAVAASDTGSDAVFTNTVSRLAIYNNDIALSAFQANPTQVQRQITARGVSGSTATSAFTYVANGTKVILLRCWTTGGSEDLSLRWGRGLTTDDVAGGVRLPNGDNLGVATVALGRTTTYASSGTYPATNNANANVVSAANGLRRGTWSLVGSTTQNVIYIAV
jgi:hypothetical protein